jgi:basic membrane lipoprotein Med (substrate-binding protein (PBP1-ABC) superfamily)/DNA-binding SARP family transcriptional activator
MTVETETLFRVLGPVGVDADGRRLRLGPPLQRTLLGTLVLHHDEVVSTSGLIEALWGDQPPRTASHSLQSYISGLRAVLGADRIETRPPGFVLHARPDEIDACRFECAVREATESLHAGHARDAASRLEEALSWWRGAPLADLPDDEPMAGEIARLEEQHLRARETWVAARLALGEHVQLLPELERMTHHHPLREPLWGHLMVALHRSGRPGDALLAFQRARAALAEELGTDPSAELTALYEAILVQDPHLLAPMPTSRPPPAASAPAARNPYKGLRPFTEADADDFFGRDELLRELLERLAAPAQPLLAVVGPSGSGKSSVVRAGLVPALRADGLPGLGAVDLVTLLPGRDPSGALAAALATVTAGDTEAAVAPRDATGRLAALLDQRGRAARPLVVVIDQFEEVFTLGAEPAEQRRFLDDLDSALADHSDQLRVVVALRADHYDRPLTHPRFGRRVASGTVVALPLAPEELEAAAARPARRVGAALEPALVTALVADLADQPGALPLFQYALTQLFEHRRDGTLTLEAYRAFGAIDGVVSRRADDLHAHLQPAEQAVARQLFLRLVQAGEDGIADVRRRVPARELATLAVDPVALQTVLDRFGPAQLLSFDRDPVAGGMTVELAHDALLQAWGRLRSWIDTAREDLRRRLALATAMEEWRAADEDADELLIGARLARYEAWAATTSLVLTENEQRYLAVSVARRDREQAAEDARREAETRLRHRAALRLWGLAASVVLLVAVAAVGANLFLAGPTASVWLLRYGGQGEFEAYLEASLARIDRELDVATDVRITQADPVAELRSLCTGDADLVIVGAGDLADEGIAAASDCPDTLLALLDANALAEVPRCAEAGAPAELCLPDNVLPVAFSTEEGSFLAGAAAALTTRTGAVGFIGGNRTRLIEEFRAGFEAGAHHVDPDVRVLAIALTDSVDPAAIGESYVDAPMGRQAALQLYGEDVDVIFTAAGSSGTGAMVAAEELHEPDRPLWGIGVDTDWELTHPELADRLLTSMVKRFDVAMLDLGQRLVDDTLAPGIQRYGLAEGGLELSRRGGHLEAIADRLDELSAAIVAGEIEVPSWPTGPVLPTPEQAQVLVDAELAYTGTACVYTGPERLDAGSALAVELVDRSGDGFTGMAYHVEAAPALDPAPSEVPIGSMPPDWMDLASLTWRAVEPGGRTTLTVPAVAGTTVELGCQVVSGDGERWVNRRAVQVEITG